MLKHTHICYSFHEMDMLTVTLYRKTIEC